MDVTDPTMLVTCWCSGAAKLDGGAQGLRLWVFARLSASRGLVLSEFVHGPYSFTCFAYSSSGTFNRFAIAICEGVNLTVLRPFGDDDFEAVDSAEATLGPESRFAS